MDNMESINTKQRLFSNDPFSNLAFDVTLKRLRTGRNRRIINDYSVGLTQDKGTSADAGSEQTATGPSADPIPPVTQFNLDEQGRISRLVNPKPLDEFFTVTRTIFWQSKIISKREVCPGSCHTVLLAATNHTRPHAS
jgi:hypothetical protein